MKHGEKFSAIETTVGKYSSRKIPQWRMGQQDLLELLDTMDLEEDASPSSQSA